MSGYAPGAVLGSSQGATTEAGTNAVDRPLVWWAGLFLMCSVLVIPILAVKVPPLTDYPNHLARCYVLAYGDADPVLRQMFSPRWQVIPNIAVDLILPPLMHVFSPFTAGRIILAFCLLVPTSGTIALSYAYFQRRSFWQMSAGFAAFNALFLMGFMNFELGIGIALWGAAAWIAYRERYPAAAVVGGMLVATLAFFFHLFGFCFYALLIGCHELSVVFRRGVRIASSLRYGLARALLLAVSLVVPVILYAVSPLGKLNVAVSWGGISRKLWMTLAPFVDYSIAFDLLTVAPVIAILVACVIARRVRVSRSALMCSVVLLAGYAVLPSGMKGVWWVDSRMVVMLAFMIAAGFLPTGLSARQESVGAGVLGVLFVAKIAFITSVWTYSQRDIADVRQVISAVTPGSRVLDVDVTPHDNPGWYASMPVSRRIPHLGPTYWHLASFVLLDRHAFWPTMFAIETQQPILVKEPYREMLGIGTPPANYMLLTLPQLPMYELNQFPFLADWNHKFDYVLVLNAEGAPNLENFLPDRLELLERRGIAALFRVRK